MPADESFFDVSKEQSVVKATIVEKYFDAWAGIIAGAQNARNGGGNIGYIDLFAGPGRYRDNTVSTPIRVLQKAISRPAYAQRLKTIFNDKDEANVQTLQQAINEIAGIETLAHKPIVMNREVGDKIAADFQSINTIPILAFVDPWGYKGLTLKLVNAFIKDWGCDCIFFFNYGRINAGLSNPKVKAHMQALFGDEEAESLSQQLEPMEPHEREFTIVNALARALRKDGPRYVLPFCFKNDKGTRTSHHLILVTKHFKGYDVMKDIMAKESSEAPEGVPSFMYNPAVNPNQEILFELTRPLAGLEESLLKDFAGKSLSMRQIYECHSIDKPFISRNYKAALAKLRKDGRVRTDRDPRGNTFADNIIVSFPPR